MLSASLRALLWAVVALALAAGLIAGIWSRSASEPPPSAGTLQLRLPDAQGRVRALTEWQGKVVLLNFWATWCAPCREEIPLLNEAQTRYAPRGLQVIGIAIDNVPEVTAYQRQFRINYPVLIGDLETLSLTERFGNTSGVLPYTLIVNTSGHVVDRKAGAYRKGELDASLDAALSTP